MRAQHSSMKLSFEEILVIGVFLLASLLGALLAFSSLSGVDAIVSTLFVFFAPGIITASYYGPFIKKNLVELTLYILFIYLFLGIAVYIVNLFVFNVPISYVVTYILFSFFSLIRMLLKNPEKVDEEDEKKAVKHKDIWVDSCLLALVFVISRYVYYAQVPVWSTLNTDALTHLIAMKEIFVNHVFSLNLPEISNAFTVTSYLPNFHILFGPVLMSLGNTMSAQLYNFLEMAIVFISTFALYTIVSSKGYRFAGLLLAVMNLLVFERIAAYTSLFLLPQTLTAFLAELLLLSLLFKEKLSLWTYIFYALLLVTSHFPIGTLGLGICFAFFLLSTEYVSLSLVKFMQIIILYMAISVGLFGTTYLQYFSAIIPDFQARVSELVLLDFNLFLSTLLQMFGLGIGILAFLILISFFVKDKALLIFSTILLVLITIILLQIPYSGKLLVYVHYIGITFIAVGVMRIEKYVRNRFVMWLVIVLVAGGMLFPLLAASDQFKRTLYQDNYFGLITRPEKDILGFIESLPEGKIISDPLSMTIFESQTKHRSLGGIYTSIPLRTAVWNVLNKKIAVTSSASNDKPIYVLVTTRTVYWAKQDEAFIQGYANQIWNVPTDDIWNCSEFTHLGAVIYSTNKGCVYLSE